MDPKKADSHVLPHMPATSGLYVGMCQYQNSYLGQANCSSVAQITFWVP